MCTEYRVCNYCLSWCRYVITCSITYLWILSQNNILYYIIIVTCHTESLWRVSPNTIYLWIIYNVEFFINNLNVKMFKIIFFSIMVIF